MRYTNGVKEYLSCFLGFGGSMGGLYALVYGSWQVGLLMGLACGGLFTLFIFSFCKLVEKKADRQRAEIAAVRHVICDGGATVAGVGGWMFLTEVSLEFYPHKVNLTHETLTVPLADIRLVETKGNRVVIRMAGERILTVVVSKQKQWKIQIEEARRAASALEGSFV